jgi:hypothetical protein
MCGQDRPKLHPVEEATDLGVADAERSQPLERLAHPFVERLAGVRSLAAPQDPQALLLFGEVREQEVCGECPRDRGELLDRQGVERAELGGGIGRAPAADCIGPEPFDQVEPIRPFLLGDHLPEQGSEELDLAGERIGGGRAADALRFGTQGCGFSFGASRGHARAIVPRRERAV